MTDNARRNSAALEAHYQLPLRSLKSVATELAVHRPMSLKRVLKLAQSRHAVSGKLLELAADGVTDPEELRNRVLESLGVSNRAAAA